MSDQMPRMKPIAPEHVERCAHVAAQNHLAIHAAVTLQPVTASPLQPVVTLLCTRCALAVSEAVVAAVQAEYERAKPSVR